MPTEAQNRDTNFREGSHIPGLAFDLLHYEYGVRSKLWKQAMINGLEWTGIPGLRGIARGTSRNLTFGGGSFNKLGINTLNRGVQEVLSNFNATKNVNFVEKGISGFGAPGRFIGNILGGTQNSTIGNMFKINGIPKGSEQIATKALETNWWSALVGKISPTRKEALQKFTFKTAKGKFASRTSVAWKFAISQKFAPAAIRFSNLAFFASLTMPIAAAAGRFAAGGINTAERLTASLNRRSVDFGGKIHQSYISGAGITERQRALMELQTSRTNARTLIGEEGRLYHR